MVISLGVVGEVVGSGDRAADPSLGDVFTSAGASIVGVIFVPRRTLVLPSAESLASHPDDSLMTILSRRFSHSESLEERLPCDLRACAGLALFGLILRFMGCNFQP
jgi:hypothetical protein